MRAEVVVAFSPRAFVRWALALSALAFVPQRALADLPEPPVNEGATAVQVDGTTVRAEAWALGRGHAVEAVVVARLEPRPTAGKPRVTTFERWTLDGKTKAERGDKKLGAEWAKRLEAMLDEASRAARASGGEGKGEDPAAKGRGLLERMKDVLGPTGSRTLDGWDLGWSIDVSESEGGAGRSVARAAVITLRPAPPSPTAPPGDGDAPGGDVTPGDRPKARVPLLHGIPLLGGASGHATASGSSHADSERGARAHAKVETDLGATPPTTCTPPEVPVPPAKDGDVTPPAR